MKLGSLKAGGRDGSLIVVSRDLSQAVRATGIAATLQQALEDWENVAPRLNALSEALHAGQADGAFPLDMQALAAPLPRAYEFVDGMDERQLPLAVQCFGHGAGLRPHHAQSVAREVRAGGGVYADHGGFLPSRHRKSACFRNRRFVLFCL